MKSTVKM